MFILIGLFFVILAIICLIVAVVYGVLANNHIRKELENNNDSNLNTAQKYSLAAYIIQFIAIAFMIVLFVGGVWRYRHNFDSEEQVELSYSHTFGAILALLIIAMLVAVPVLLLTARNNFVQYTTSDVKTLNYIDYSWFLTTASFILAAAALAIIAARLNYHNAMIDCAFDAFSMCKERLQKNRCGGMMNAPRGSPMNM